MKASSLAGLFFLSSMTVMPGQAAPEDIASKQTLIGERGPHSREWLKVTSVTNRIGGIVTRTNTAYVELATGMHYVRSGRWVESKEQVEILAEGGAAATNGQHKRQWRPCEFLSGQRSRRAMAHAETRPRLLLEWSNTETTVFRLS